MAKKKQGKGSVTQLAEDLTFNQEVEGSTPSGPTMFLVHKKCQHCATVMYVHCKGDEVTFVSCEPTLYGLHLERTGEDEMTIMGKRSEKRVRCQNCRKVHLINSFEEVKDGDQVSKTS